MIIWKPLTFYQWLRAASDEEESIYGDGSRGIREAFDSMRLHLANLDRDSQHRDIHHNLLNHVSQAPLSLSVDVIRIRHLISLQEQNVAVLGELLAKLSHAHESNDLSLITMIALEPSLLDISPLRRECYADILDLALKAVASDNTVDLRADALYVMSRLDNPLDHILLTLNKIEDEAFLVQLAFVLISLHAKTHPAEAPKAANSLRSCRLSPVYQFDQDRVQLRLDAHAALSPARLAETLDEVDDQLASFFAATSYHGSMTPHLKVLNEWLLKEKRDKVLLPSEPIIDLFRNLIKFFTENVVPAMRALTVWSESTRNREAMNKFVSAAVALTGTLKKMEVHLNQMSSGSIDEQSADILTELWKDIRSQSFAKPTNISLGACVSTPSPAILDRYLPEIFSMPQSAVDVLALGRDMHIVTRSLPNNLLVVVTVPLVRLVTLLELILVDMETHGSPESFEAHFAIGLLPTHLVLEFTNILRNHDVQGTRQSQAKARTLAKTLGLEIIFPAPVVSGQKYVTTLRFPKPIICNRG